MKVNLEVQCLCVEESEIRGIPYYTLELLKSLVSRKKNEYAISFFDYNRERHNREYIEKYCEEVKNQVEMYECNDLSYGLIIDCSIKRDSSDYDYRTYEDYTKSIADIYHFPHSVIFPANAPVGKSIVTVHDIIPIVDERTKIAQPKFCEHFKCATETLAKREDIEIIAVSESTKKDLIEHAGIKEERINVIPNAYNNTLYYHDEEAAVLTHFGINKPYILYLGALDYRKGVDVLIRALDFFDNDDVQIVLAGKAAKEVNIDELVSNSNHKSNIVLTGYVTDTEKRVLLSMAEVFIFPSFYEGFGMPVLEAMACGTPVITTSSSSLPEVGGEAAIYIKPGDAEELSHQIKTILSDPSLREKYKKKSLEQAKQFSWNKTAEMTEEIYKCVFKKSN